MRRTQNIQTRFAIAGYCGPFKDEYARDDVEGVRIEDIFDRLAALRFQKSKDFANNILRAVA